MTQYNMPEQEQTIGFGPGAVYVPQTELGWLSADVAMRIEYESHAPQGQTRAVLGLVAEQVDPELGLSEIHIQIELTQGDIEKIVGVGASLLEAIAQDEGEA